MSDRLNTLARTLVDAQTVQTAAKAAADKADKAYAAAEQAFWNQAYNEGFKTGVLELGGDYGDVQFQRQETITGSVLKGREKEAYAALKAEGLATQVFDEGRPTLRKAVLNQIVRTRVKAGQPLPLSVNHSSRKYVTITKKKGSS